MTKPRRSTDAERAEARRLLDLLAEDRTPPDDAHFWPSRRRRADERARADSDTPAEGS